MNFRLTLLTMSVVAVLGLAACSDDADSSPSASTARESASATPTPSPSSSPASSEGPAADPAVCASVAEATAAFRTFGNVVMDPDKGGPAAAEVIAAMGSVERAPAEVQRSARGVRKLFQQVVQGGGYDLSPMAHGQAKLQEWGALLAAFETTDCAS